MNKKANAFKQHIPNFVSVDEYPDWIEFDTLDELLDIGTVRTWRDDHGYFLAQSDECLISVRDDGKRWFVVGYLRARVEGLPEWMGYEYPP